MIHHPLTSLAIFSLLLSIFRVLLTGRVVNALLSLQFSSNCAGISLHATHLILGEI